MLRWSKIKSKKTLFALGAIFALTGAIRFFDPLDIAASSGANKLRTQEASGDIVIVGMDEFLQEEQAAWPWAQDDIAQAISIVLDAGAKQVVLSHEVPLVGAQIEDRLDQLVKANSDKLYIVEPANMGEGWSEGRSIAGNTFASSATPVHAQPFVRFWGGVEYDVFKIESNGRILSSVAAILADRHGELNEYYPIDYAINAETIPYVSLGTIFAVEESRALLSGKSVILGFEAPPNVKPFKLLGQGQYGLATLIAIQAETLKRGRPVVLPWVCCMGD